MSDIKDFCSRHNGIIVTKNKNKVTWLLNPKLQWDCVGNLCSDNKQKFLTQRNIV